MSNHKLRYTIPNLTALLNAWILNCVVAAVAVYTPDKSLYWVDTPELAGDKAADPNVMDV